MWDFYLVSCEAAFRTGEMMVFQLQIATDRDTLPATRDYMFSNSAASAETARTPEVLQRQQLPGARAQNLHRQIRSS
jgi:hypothetical protein